MFPAPTDAALVGGYWVIPISLVIGLLSLLATHRGARALVRRWRERRALKAGIGPTGPLLMR